MITIKPLRFLSEDEFKRINTGYVSKEVYQVEKNETTAQTTIILRLKKLKKPYYKQFKVHQSELTLYRKILLLGFSLGAYADDHLIGISIAEPKPWNKSLWVWEFHIQEAYRGQGLGKSLMNELAELALAQELRCLVCETQNTNVPAIRFYRQLGFEIDGIDLSYYSNQDLDNEIAIFMKRKLNS